MEWSHFVLLLLAALVGKVARCQLPVTVVSCFAGAGCSGSVVSQNTTWRDCCQLQAAQSFLGINGECRDCSELVVEFAITSYTVSEGAGFVGLEVVKWGETSSEIVLNFTLGSEGDSAEGGDDFGPFPEPVVSLFTILLFNESTLSFGVPIEDDSIVENTESFTVRLGLVAPPPGLQLGLSEATVAITDNDVVNVTVLPENLEVSVEEGRQELSFTLIRSGLTVRDVTVMVRTQPGTAQDPVDFVAHSELVSFAVVEEQRTITITINDDDIVESTEQFLVVLEVPPGEIGVMIPQGFSTVTITDNDMLRLEFTSTDIIVAEADGSTAVGVIKQGRNERPVTVDFSTQNGTATDTEDYTAVQGTLVFGPSDMQLSIPINVSMDGIFEDTESFSVSLSVPANETGVILGPSTATINITDCDTVTIGFEEDTVAVPEEAGEVIVRASLLEGVLATDVDVQLDCTSGQAIAEEDFECPTMTLTFSESTLEQNVSISVIDDVFFEGIEDFDVRLTSSSVRVLIAGVADVTISDNEDLLIAFDQEVYSVSESNSSVEVSVILSVPLNRPLEVFLVTVDDTATAGMDYVRLNQTLRFTPSVLQQRVQIMLIDDILNDGVETFLLQLLPASDNLGASGILAEATVEIEDDEVVIIEFGQAIYTVDEGNEFVGLNITKSGETQEDFIVQVILLDRTAVGGRDYGPFSEPMLELAVVILSNETEFNFGVLIREDTIVEDTESFAAILQLPPGTVPGDSLEANVFILDNDVVDITLMPENVTVDEGDRNVIFTVSRDRDTVLNRAVGVEFMTESGSALAGADFNSLTRTLIFASNVTEFSVSVEINEDLIAEGTEQFSVILSRNSEPAAMIVQNTATVFITDDDVVQVEFDRAEYSVSEDAGFVNINVVKTGQSETAVTVGVATADGTATAPFDYNATVTSVTFGTADTERVVSLQVIDDAVFEGNEVFSVNLFIIPGSEDPVVLGSTSTTSITIVENDFVVIQFALPAYTVGESDGFAVVSVIKRMNNSRPVTVRLETEPGTATAGLDYTPIAMNIQFQPGGAEEQRDISIPIINNLLNERDEIFTARLEIPSTETGVILVSTTTTSITIFDDDFLSVEFEQASYTVNEGESVQICITQQGRSETAVNVTVATRTLTAIGGVDFETKSGVLSLEPPATRVCCDIQTLADNEQEPIEIFQVLLLQVPDGVNVTRDNTNVSISDRNCSLIIAIEQEVYTVGESDGSAIVCVTTQSTVTASAVLTTLPSVEPVFNRTTNLLSFDPPADRECCSIPLNNNAVGLEESSFGVALQSVSTSPPVVMCIGTSEATVVVTDDDIVTVEFTSANYSVNEADGVVQVCVTKDRNTAIDLSVTVIPTETSPPQAQETNDFDPVPRSIVLPAQEAVACTDIPIVSDGVPEGIEIFLVQLVLPDLTGLQLGRINEATVAISDGGPPTVPPVLVNDTVIGDPLFTVPLRLNSTSQSLLRSIIARRRLQNRLPHLCYEIHGSVGSIFNLVSDVCTSVNALYTRANISQDLNVISTIGVRAVNLRQRCIDIRISVEDDCMPSITEPGRPEFSTSQYSSFGVSVRKFGQKVRVTVPNCENIQLVMWVTCREVSSSRMIRFVITRGINLTPTSHGFLGQFWNIPITVEPFVPTREDPYFLEEELFTITINPVDSQQRRFVAEFYDQVWDTTPGVCFYVGSNQAGPIGEIDEPNDSVIQGVYSDYRVSGLFDSEYMYSRFNDLRCT